MYLSKVILKYSDCELAFKCKDIYQTHKTLCSVMDVKGDKFIYAEMNERMFYVLSEFKPIPTEIATVESKSLPDSFIETGKRFKFNIDVSAIKKLNGCEIPMKTHQQVEEWFLKRTNTIGATFEINMTSNHNYIARKGSTQIRINSNKVSGVLTITDCKKFMIALKQGIGKRKSFGFGMFLLMPII